MNKKKKKELKVIIGINPNSTVDVQKLMLDEFLRKFPQFR